VSSYVSFSDVEKAVGSCRVGSHDELVAAVVSALEHELPKYCKRNLVQYALRPMMGRHLRSRRRPDIRLGNLVIEVETPGGGLDAGRSQLRQYMRELASMAPWLDAVHGIVTNGVYAEYYVLGRGGEPEPKMRGSLGEVAAAALANFCAGKVPVVSPEDLVEVLGV
jgi:hypothetical protein